MASAEASPPASRNAIQLLNALSRAAAGPTELNAAASEAEGKAQGHVESEAEGGESLLDAMLADISVEQRVSAPAQQGGEASAAIDAVVGDRNAGTVPETHLPRTRGREGEVMSLEALPRGKQLRIRILTTHGDPFYAGLTGLQLLVAEPLSVSEAAEAGWPVGSAASVGRVRAVTPALQQLHASPSSINVDGHSGDPRTLDKLVDGVCRTCDDTHMWLIPFTASGYADAGHLVPVAESADAHVLTVTLPAPSALAARPTAGVQPTASTGLCHLAGLRLWNYNKDSEGAARGIRHVMFDIDGVPLLDGAFVRQSKQATEAGSAGGAASMQLPVDAAVLQLRRAPGACWHDFAQDFLFSALPAPTAADAVPSAAAAAGIPSAAQGSPHLWLAHSAEQLVRAAAPALAAATAGAAAASKYEAGGVGRPAAEHTLRGCEFRFVLTASLGDPFYVGLDALALYDPQGTRIRVPPWAIAAAPASVGGSDCRLPTNLAFWPASGAPGGKVQHAEHNTPDEDAALLVDPSHPIPFPAARAWLAPFPDPPPDPSAGGKRSDCVVLSLRFDAPVEVALVRLWNYSRNAGRGVGTLELWVDGTLAWLGDLSPAPAMQPQPPSAAKRGARDAAAGRAVLRPYHPLVFSADRAALSREVALYRAVHAAVGAAPSLELLTGSGGEQETLLFNDGVLARQLSSRRALQRHDALRAALDRSKLARAGAAAEPAHGWNAKRPATTMAGGDIVSPAPPRLPRDGAAAKR
jgi:hypothetical protein